MDGGSRSTPDLRLALLLDRRVEAEELKPGLVSLREAEDCRAEKEREEGIMEAREDLLEVMLGNNTTKRSVQSSPRSKPTAAAVAAAAAAAAPQGSDVARLQCNNAQDGRSLNEEQGHNKTEDERKGPRMIRHGGSAHGYDFRRERTARQGRVLVICAPLAGALVGGGIKDGVSWRRRWVRRIETLILPCVCQALGQAGTARLSEKEAHQ
jgi:hypothetical protein